MGLYDVNGKTPVAAWVPTRDDAGNGTTTLNDSVGAIDGTLTNFALSGSTSNWVADTSAGGVRAIASDGTNDRIAVADNSSLEFGTGDITISLWFCATTNPGSFGQLITKRGTNTTGNARFDGYAIGLNSSGYIVASFRHTTSSDVDTLVTGSTDLCDGAWHHVVAVYDRDASLTVYVDGSSIGTVSIAYASAANINTLREFTICARNTALAIDLFYAGKFDDLRIWQQSLDAADAAWLWYSGVGRGRLFSSDWNDSGMFGGMPGAMTGGMAS